MFYHGLLLFTILITMVVAAPFLIKSKAPEPKPRLSEEAKSLKAVKIFERRAFISYAVGVTAYVVGVFGLLPWIFQWFDFPMVIHFQKGGAAAIYNIFVLSGEGFEIYCRVFVPLFAILTVLGVILFERSGRYMRFFESLAKGLSKHQ